MNSALIIALIQAAAQFTRAVAPLVKAAMEVLNSQDQASIRTALLDLQVANDELFERTQDKLRRPPSS